MPDPGRPGGLLKATKFSRLKLSRQIITDLIRTHHSDSYSSRPDTYIHVVSDVWVLSFKGWCSCRSIIPVQFIDAPLIIDAKDEVLSPQRMEGRSQKALANQDLA